MLPRVSFFPVFWSGLFFVCSEYSHPAIVLQCSSFVAFPPGQSDQINWCCIKYSTERFECLYCTLLTSGFVLRFACRGMSFRLGRFVCTSEEFYNFAPEIVIVHRFIVLEQSVMWGPRLHAWTKTLEQRSIFCILLHPIAVTRSIDDILSVYTRRIQEWIGCQYLAEFRSEAQSSLLSSKFLSAER